MSLQLKKSPQAKRRLEGFLRLETEHDGTGKTYLATKAFRTPIHISKPYWDGRSLLVNAMSPTAGLLEGDRIDIDVSISGDTSMTLSNPSALRAHKMDTGWAKLNQSYRVKANGFLEVNPEWLILQGESRFDQRTSIILEESAELIYIEPIAPGRVAHNEAFAFKRFRNRLSLEYGGRLAALEKFDIQPELNQHRPWSTAFEAPYFVSIFVASQKLKESSSIWEQIYDANCDSLRVGSSQLAIGPIWNIKLLASDASDARKAINSIRLLLYEGMGRKASPLRRQ